MDQEEILIHPSAKIHSTAIVEAGVGIGANTQVWLYTHIEKNARIGSNCLIGQNVYIGRDVRLGNGVKVQNNVSVYEGVVCEEDVFLGPSAVFTNIINPRSAVSRKHLLVATLVKKGATIGANATIVCGNNIGTYAMIGAGAVVTKPVPNYALIIGNPGKQVGWVSEYGNKLLFDENSWAICSETGQQYQLKNGVVIRTI